MMCEWTVLELNKVQCVYCETIRPYARVRVCQSEAPRKTNRQATFQLGTAIESVISTIGVTPERWVAFKSVFGLPKVCQCEDRKKYLNAVGAEFGAATRKAVAKLIKELKP